VSRRGRGHLLPRAAAGFVRGRTESPELPKRGHTMIRSFLPRASCTSMLLGTLAVSVAGPAAADSTDDYPIPHRIIITTCDAEQYLAAARDTSPVYYSRYMIDKSNRPADVQQMAQDRIHWFFSLDPAARRQYSEDTATNVYYEQVATHWGNWAKVF